MLWLVMSGQQKKIWLCLPPYLVFQIPAEKVFGVDFFAGPNALLTSCLEAQGSHCKVHLKTAQM